MELTAVHSLRVPSLVRSSGIFLLPRTRYYVFLRDVRDIVFLVLTRNWTHDLPTGWSDELSISSCWSFDVLLFILVRYNSCPLGRKRSGRFVRSPWCIRNRKKSLACPNGPFFSTALDVVDEYSGIWLYLERLGRIFCQLNVWTWVCTRTWS